MQELADAARARATVGDVEPEPQPDPLDDVVIEMDNPAFQPPPKASKKK